MTKALTCPECKEQLPDNLAASCPFCANPLPPPDGTTINRSDESDFSQNTLEYQSDASEQSQDTLDYSGPSNALGPSSLTFGNYDLLGELGRGGMGVVYRARQKKADRMVALKVMRDHERVSEEEKERFTVEVRALARVSHPNIVGIYEVGEEEGCPFFTMEYVDGKPLSHRDRQEPMSAADAALLIERIAGAVHAAHSVGVLHRDIKPGNVLIDSEGNPKLTDFGLAKHLDQDSGLTIEGSALGTPSFMSPEQAGGELEKVTATADVYSLGATLYDLQTGQPPFRGETAGGTLAKVLKEDVIPPSKIRPGLSPELEAVCLKCLEKNPARRYATALELAEDLQRWRKGEATRVRPWSWRRRMWRRTRRHWKPIMAIAAMALMVIAFVYTFIITDPEYRDRQAMLAVDRAIEKGERVELVGPIGPPKWLRKVVDIEAEVSSDPNTVFQVKTNRAALIQLAPSAHHDSYRIRCELRTRSSTAADSSSGIYFAHNLGENNSDGYVERFVVFHHKRNLGDTKREKDLVKVQDFLLEFEEGVVDVNSGPSLGNHEYTIDLMLMQEPWRTLELEVTPKYIRAYWFDGDENRKLVGRWNQPRNSTDPVSTEIFERISKRHHDDLDRRKKQNMVRRLEYAPRKSFGIFVRGAVVDFRNVTFEPIADSTSGP